MELSGEVERYVNDTNEVYISSVGEYIKEIKRPLLTPEEEQELFIKYRNGDKEAKEQLIESNLRLVISVAKRYSEGVGSLEFSDLIQEGNLGLIKAVERFDVSKGYRFSTYATWWIVSKINRALSNQSRNIRIPVHASEKQLKIKHAVERLECELGRTATISEIEEVTGLTYEQFQKYMSLQDPISLNMSVFMESGEEDSELLELIPSHEMSFEDKAIGSIMQEQVRALISDSKLTERQQGIIRMRYGIGNQEPMTLDEVGQVYGVTRERIRQIEAKALKRLKTSAKRKGMYTYIDAKI